MSVVIPHARIIYKTQWRWYLKSLELSHAIVDTIVDKKGSNIILLDIRDQATFADYFLICNGDNVRQIDTIAEEITIRAKKQIRQTTIGVEGSAASGWILIDLGDLIVHVFSPEQRAYFQLEDIWDQAHVVMRMH